MIWSADLLAAGVDAVWHGALAADLVCICAFPRVAVRRSQFSVSIWRYDVIVAI